VLTSAEAKPCIYQHSLPAGTGEATGFPEIADGLHEAYGRSGMIGIIDGDAGLTSLRNASYVNQLGYGYILGLKGNQAELYAEARALLIPKSESEEPESETPWELRNGKSIRRRLWRTDEMQGFENSVGTWDHLRQTWLVRQESVDTNGTMEVEDRYFLSSLLWNFLTPGRILLAVRNHWGVENNAFNSLDLQWHEDKGPWCTMGTSVAALGVTGVQHSASTPQTASAQKECVRGIDGPDKLALALQRHRERPKTGDGGCFRRRLISALPRRREHITGLQACPAACGKAVVSPASDLGVWTFYR